MHRQIISFHFRRGDKILTFGTQTLLQTKFNQQFTKNPRRETIEILAEILLLCNNQKRKTIIMQKTNLCYKGLMKHLAYLTQLDMLERDKAYFFTTKKGDEFLEVYANLQRILYDNNKDRSYIQNLE